MAKSTGTAMHTVRLVRPGLGRHAAPTLTRAEKVRLDVLDWLHADPSRTITAAARHFGFHRNTISAWKQRFNPTDLRTLKPRSRRPKHVRQAVWTMADATAVRELRLLYPTWGKDKLHVLLAADGFSLSVSTIGRILSWLKARGRLIEPKRHRQTVPSANRASMPPESRRAMSPACPGL